MTAFSSARLERRVADARALFSAAVRGAGADRLLESVDWDALAAPRYRRVRLVALGKAALPMAGVAARQMARRGVAVDEGLAVVPEGYRQTVPARFPAPPAAVEVVEGGHPVPTRMSIRAGQRALELAARSGAGDFLLVLLSGGGTALCNAFAEGLSLGDVQRTFGLLLESGADIHALNTVRKHLSRVGGGQLARAAAPARSLALAVSDVPGDDLSVIASGPMVPDPTTFADAQAVLRDYALWERVPASVRARIDDGRHDRAMETPGPQHACFRMAETRLAGSNAAARAAAHAEAERRGYVAEEGGALSGEARVLGRRLAQAALHSAAACDDAAREAAGEAPARCRLLGGETTVTVRGGGAGGRNQELALAAALALEGAEQPVVLLCAGTDGIDGPTGAAGAVVTPQTAAAIRREGLDPDARLHDNDSYPALEAAGALVCPGPTHTNVMDVAAVLLG